MIRNIKYKIYYLTDLKKRFPRASWLSFAAYLRIIKTSYLFEYETFIRLIYNV